MLLPLYIYFIFCCSLSSAAQQKNSLSIGLNTSYFKDWKKIKLNIFNPEINYSHLLSDKYRVNYTINTFYGSNYSQENMKEGAVVYRLIFSNDLTLDYLINDFFISAGPTFRYRREKKSVYFYPQPNPFEFVITGNKPRFNIGGAIKTGYDLKIKKRSFLSFKLTYRIYNQGVNPVSLGVAYGFGYK
jgi:hypothetical protein